MSTRSITVFKEDGAVCGVMYLHADGYPTGHGAELKEFLSRCTSLRGLGRDVADDGIISSDDTDGSFTANGITCLAAQTVTYFKDGPGHIYLVPIDRDAVDDYRYVVYAMNDDSIGLKVQRGTTGFDDRYEEGRHRWVTLFKGPVAEFDPEETEARALEAAEYRVLVVDVSGSMSPTYPWSRP